MCTSHCPWGCKRPTEVARYPVVKCGSRPKTATTNASCIRLCNVKQEHPRQTNAASRQARSWGAWAPPLPRNLFARIQYLVGLALFFSEIVFAFGLTWFMWDTTLHLQFLETLADRIINLQNICSPRCCWHGHVHCFLSLSKGWVLFAYGYVSFAYG